MVGNMLYAVRLCSGMVFRAEADLAERNLLLSVAWGA